LAARAARWKRRTRAAGYFEVDDTKCKDGHYGIKLNNAFKIISITRD
jgi:hypothetical protein